MTAAATAHHPPASVPHTHDTADERAACEQEQEALHTRLTTYAQTTERH